MEDEDGTDCDSKEKKFSKIIHKEDLKILCNKLRGSK